MEENNRCGICAQCWHMKAAVKGNKSMYMRWYCAVDSKSRLMSEQCNNGHFAPRC